MCGWGLLLLWGLLPGAAAGGSGRTLPHRTVLDSEGKYWLGWGQRGSRLAVRLEVRTAGYVGFGFSPTGAMAAADIVVGGVAHGRPYLQPCLLAVSKTEACDEKCLQQQGNCCWATRG
uniref:Monooxygenase DBH like 1 n=1 Tax=Microcebus murinus TaxID=30608 RepID=A0A8C5XKP2_MICMU